MLIIVKNIIYTIQIKTSIVKHIIIVVNFVIVVIIIAIVGNIINIVVNIIIIVVITDINFMICIFFT